MLVTINILIIKTSGRPPGGWLQYQQKGQETGNSPCLLPVCSSWFRPSSPRSPQRRTHATLTRSSQRRPSPSLRQRNVSRTALSNMAAAASCHGRCLRRVRVNLQGAVEGISRSSVCLSTDDEDGMDAADNERRPHFPQFSYSASGRE